MQQRNAILEPRGKIFSFFPSIIVFSVLHSKQKINHTQNTYTFIYFFPFFITYTYIYIYFCIYTYWYSYEHCLDVPIINTNNKIYQHDKEANKFNNAYFKWSWFSTITLTSVINDTGDTLNSGHKHMIPYLPNVKIHDKLFIKHHWQTLCEFTLFFLAMTITSLF